VAVVKHADAEWLGERQRRPRSGNVASGYGGAAYAAAGAAWLFGLICVRTGYPAAFALTGASILAAVPAALRERNAAASAAAARR